MKENEAGLGSVVKDVRGWMSNDIPTPPGYRWEIGELRRRGAVVTYVIGAPQ